MKLTALSVNLRTKDRILLRACLLFFLGALDILTFREGGFKMSTDEILEMTTEETAHINSMSLRKITPEQNQETIEYIERLLAQNSN